MAARGALVDVPAFRGRCLDAAYLAAVAAGAWSPDDELRLAAFEERVDATVVGRVERRQRRGLRTAARAAARVLLTAELAGDTWPARRDQLRHVCCEPTA